MSPAHSGAGGDLRAIAFASADGTAWGAAVCDGDRWSLVSQPTGPGDGGLAVSEQPDGSWRLEREGGALSLLAVPEDPPSAPVDGDAGAAIGGGAAFVSGEGPELCRVTGTASGHQVDWRGIRVRMAPQSAKEAPGSARFVAGWFADGSAVGLLAARPRRSDRPDHDTASATLFDCERWLSVTEPRLSTTYDESETPARVNLELWIGEGEHEYPRRAAGEASGPPLSALDGAGVRVTPLRCHSRGAEGVGVYVLATL